mgnify:CR=1 FL=1
MNERSGLKLKASNFSNLLKKNFVLALAGAWTLARVQVSSSLGFIMGGLLNKSPPLPESFHDVFTYCLASLCKSSLVLRYGTYDFRSYKKKTSY